MIKKNKNIQKDITNNDSRFFYLDNLRSFIIILVVVLHCSVAYSINLTTSWYVINPEKNIIFDIISLLFDRVVMPLIFFISGYFSLYSIQKYKIIDFIKKRFKRLVFPFILGLIFIAPIMIYVMHLFQHNINQNYFEYWTKTYFLKEVNSVHLWFLLSLLFFTIIFVFIYYLKKDLFITKKHNNSNLPFTKIVILLGILITILFFIVNCFISDSKWITINQFALIQPTRFVINISFFFLGIIAFKKKYLSKKYNSEKLVQWTFITLINIIATLIFYHYYYPELLKVNYLKLVNGFLLVFLCLSLLIMLLKFFYIFFNSNGVIWSNLSKNSYSIFIIHFPFVVVLQYYMLNLTISPFLKFGTAFIISFVSSYILSKYIIHKIPYLKIEEYILKNLNHIIIFFIDFFMNISKFVAKKPSYKLLLFPFFIFSIIFIISI